MDGGLLSLKWNNHRSSFIHVLSSLRKKDSFCDVTIACDGKFYPSHKFVLSTCSEYFQDMFHHTECKHPIIVLKDIRSEELEALLNYMYMGEVNVVQEKLSSLIKAAECLRIKGLAVPDDPPRETSDKRVASSCTSSLVESKRRRTDHDHHRSKDPQHTFKESMKSAPESPYKQSSISQESFQSSGKRHTDIAETSYTYPIEGPDHEFSSKAANTNFIKQELPEEDLVDLEDTKEGILESAHASFLSSGATKESSERDGLSIADSRKDIWGCEDRSEENYHPLEGGGDSGGGPNEDSSHNDTVWNSSNWSSPPSVSSMDDLSHAMFTSVCTNTGSTLYACKTCDYRCPLRANLVKHLRVHTGEKPFVCRWCSYTATQSSNLLKHIRRVHKDRIACPEEGASLQHLGQSQMPSLENLQSDHYQ